jgi:uncharacterized protein (DUF488 family)
MAGVSGLPRSQPASSAANVHQGRKTTTLHTIGYEGLDTEEFLSLLSKHDIETLVDIRELPLSRKSGFSKKALATSVKRWGIDYVHLSHLGCPKPIRNRYREDRNWTRYQRDFLKYLATQDEAIADLAAMSGKSCCALLCFEADHNRCHRSMVADAVKQVSGVGVCHIHKHEHENLKPNT